MHAPLKQFLPIFLLAALAGFLPDSTAAQDAASRTVFVAIPESFPAIDARAIILRERDRDVVMLRADDATAESLAMSLIVLRRARARERAPTNGEMIPITGYALTMGMGASYRALMNRTLEALGERPVGDLGSFGPGRFLRFQLQVGDG
jgi:hypothetical protein